MKFNEKLPNKSEFTSSPELFVKLITEKFCGDKWDGNLNETDSSFLLKIIHILRDSTINYRQFNEILLLINQDTISNDFFKFCFEAETINLDTLLEGIKKFRGFCLLCFGNFRYPYKSYRGFDESELKEIFSDYCLPDKDIMKRYADRPEKMLDISLIEKSDAWFLGYITGPTLRLESETLNKELDKKKPHDGLYSLEELTKLAQQFADYEDKIILCQQTGLKNTDIYLTWDYIDVYVATSMRNKWEFEEVFDFVKEVSANDLLGQFKLRFFDPTQSYCGNPRDKGLVEGLMLKRASSTIYLAQESDTIGKDSELAATLAQGKPVIVYVPEPDPKEYSKKISEYPLAYFKKRFLSLNANDRFDDPTVVEMLLKFGENAEDIIQNFLDEVGKFRQNQPYSLWKEKETDFKESYAEFEKICQILAEIECYHFDKRAETLRGKHPLSMQVVLETGVANGVLVVRSAAKCAILLSKILTNDMEFDILHVQEEDENALGLIESYTILEENISKSPFRMVTHQERLTNSFWNNFWRRS